MLNPRNYKLDLEKLFELDNRYKREYIQECYNNMLQFYNEYRRGEPTEDMYLSYFNTLKSNGYIIHSPQMNNDEYLINKKTIDRNNKIDGLLD